MSKSPSCVKLKKEDNPPKLHEIYQRYLKYKQKMGIAGSTQVDNEPAPGLSVSPSQFQLKYSKNTSPSGRSSHQPSSQNQLNYRLVTNLAKNKIHESIK